MCVWVGGKLPCEKVCVGGGKGDSCERSGILVISLRDVNRGFWSDEEFSGRNAKFFLAA